jgi:hypothetical protein
MDHPIHRVERFEIVGPYTLVLEFHDGTQQRIDFRPVLEGELFGPLQDLQAFNTVQLDPTFGTIQWPNGADFDPETLHDWPKYRDEFVAMAKRWAAASGPHLPSGLTREWSRRATDVDGARLSASVRPLNLTSGFEGSRTQTTMNA